MVSRDGRVLLRVGSHALRRMKPEGLPSDGSHPSPPAHEPVDLAAGGEQAGEPMGGASDPGGAGDAAPEQPHGLALGGIDEADGLEPDPTSAPEGMVRYRLHRSYERSERLAREKRERARLDGALACEACGLDPALRCGALGEHCIEVHHTIPVSQMEGQRVSSLDDLALLCANCHRVAHLAICSGHPLSVEALRARSTTDPRAAPHLQPAHSDDGAARGDSAEPLPDGGLTITLSAGARLQTLQ
jgi:hypothetical protein